MRKITLIVLHCSGVMPNVHQDIIRIDEYHRSKGWKCVGYHFYVRRTGLVEIGRPIEEVGAHVLNHNRHSIGICYEGGLDASGLAEDTRTPEQVKALRELVEQMHERFPKALIVGHHDLDPTKPCPCFDVVNTYKDLQPVD